VKEFYRIGGAQAVAALAYGAKSIPPVNKIVGPGNLYVTTAKKLVAFDCAIDFLAGPTEALVVQHGGRADFIASDLVAQAEHDPEAVCVFITSSAALAKKVEREVALQAENHPIARASLQENGVILAASSRKQAMQWANQIASEHLTVEERDLPLVRNAGSVFASAYSAQAAGDYIVGPNHVLPTAGIARSRGGLTVLDFVKVITVQQVTRQGIRRVGPAAVRMAEAEGLAAHAESLRLRVNHA
jgi:histidinol dehydrogenase